MRWYDFRCKSNSLYEISRFIVWFTESGHYGRIIHSRIDAPSDGCAEWKFKSNLGWHQMLDVVVRADREIREGVFREIVKTLERWCDDTNEWIESETDEEDEATTANGEEELVEEAEE
jgi:hypothetical protein